MAGLVTGLSNRYAATIDCLNNHVDRWSHKYAAASGFLHLARGAKNAARDHKLISTIIDPLQKGIDYGVQVATRRLFRWLKQTDRYQRAQIYLAVRFFPTNDKLISVIQITVRVAARIEALTERTSAYDCTEFSCCARLISQDIQELGDDINFHFPGL